MHMYVYHLTLPHLHMERPAIKQGKSGTSGNCGLVAEKSSAPHRNISRRIGYGTCMEQCEAAKPGGSFVGCCICN